MNVRILSILGALAIMVAIWFFYQENNKVEPTVPAKPDVSYEISKIKAIQTNEKTGETEYTLTAQMMVQNTQGEDEMLDVVMTWQPPQGEQYTIKAKRAIFNQSTGDIFLSDGFDLIRMATDEKPAFIIKGSVLTGNTNLRLLSSNQPLTVINGNDTFVTQAMTANLQTGEYQFSKIKMQYDAKNDKIN